MSSVYSARFIAIQGESGTSGSVTVPAGFVYVVKQITFYSDPLFSQVFAFFEDDDSGAALFSAGWEPGTPGWFGFYGALAFEAGQGFHFHVSSPGPDAVDCYAGGYKLTA